MALVTYECDTCKRHMEKKRNVNGLDVINNCIITNGCKGKLHLTDVNLQHNIPSSTPLVDGLVDWTPRKILYTHKQTIISDRWRIVHNLGTKPLLNVYVYVGQTGDLVEIEPKTYELINENVIEITFEQPYTGIAQTTSRSSTEGQKIKTLNPSSISSSAFNSILAQDQLIISTKYTSEIIAEDFVDITFAFLNPSTFKETLISPMRFETINTSSAWGDVSKVAIQGELFKLRSQTFDQNEIINLKIQDASPFYIKEVSFGNDVQSSIPKDQVYIMLTNAPYQVFDKVLDYALDISTLTKDNAFDNTRLISGQLEVKSAIFNRIFPFINTIV